MRQIDKLELVPEMARIRIERLLERLELVMTQLEAIENARDAVAAKPAAENESERMIRDLAGLRGVGVESATGLTREAFFVREFRNQRAVGAYAGLTGTPFASGAMQREQGIGKDGARRRAGAHGGARVVLAAVPAG